VDNFLFSRVFCSTFHIVHRTKLTSSRGLHPRLGRAFIRCRQFFSRRWWRVSLYFDSKTVIYLTKYERPFIAFLKLKMRVWIDKSI